MKRLTALVLCLCLTAAAFPMTVRAAPPRAEAKSALLMEAATGKILYTQNAHDSMPPASVTKIMTLLLIMEAIDRGQLRWEDPVTASEAAAAKGGSQVFLKAGEQLSVRDMVKSVAVSSANDCACAMAELLAGSEEAFVDLMNEKAKSLSMEDTHFVNCTGLDDAPEAKDHLTSAHDIALMSRELLTKHPAIKEFTSIWMDTIRGGSFGLSNTNKLIRFYPGATGLKTGFTSRAGYCLSATAEREGMELIAVVMGCDSSKSRSAACRSLLDYGFSTYCLVKPRTEGSLTVPVKLGQEKQISAALGDTSPLLLEKRQKSLIKQELQLEKALEAPVYPGQRVGSLLIRAGDTVLAEIPMLAETGTKKLTFWQILLGLLRNKA